MAYSEEQWERTKALFESGQYSLSEISDKTGINKSQISRKSKRERWVKGSLLNKISENKESGTIYLIQAGDTEYYKIGITKISIEQRLKQLQTGNHLALKVVRLYFSEDYYYEEKQLHKQFNSKNTVGEWFKLNKEDVEYLKERLLNG